MKTILLTFILFICFYFPFEVFSQSTFVTSPYTNGFDRLEDAIERPNGDFIATGITEVNDINDDLYLVKTDKNGNGVFSKAFDSAGQGSDDGYGIINTSDNGFAVCGEINGKMSVCKFDSNDSLMWWKEYDETVGSIGNKIVQAPDNGFLIAGENPGNTAGYQDYVVKTDDTGKVVWSKRYFDTRYSDIVDLQKTKDNNYIFISQNYQAEDSTVIVKIDANGNVLWADYLYSTVANTAGYSVLSTSDNNYLITGTSTSNSVSLTPDGFLLKLDVNGNLVWSKSTNSDVNSGISLFRAIETGGGDYLACGDGYRTSSDSIFYYFLEVDPGGALVSSKTIEKESGDLSTLYSLAKTSDAGFVAAGDINLGSDNDGILMKLDNNLSTCMAEGSTGSLKDYGVFGTTAVPVYIASTVVSIDSLSIQSVGNFDAQCSALPLTLLSFTAGIRNRSVELQWQTVKEENTGYFDLEKSGDGKTFQFLQKVSAAGNSSFVNSYTAYDVNPFGGNNYYRLKMVDKDGRFIYSNVARVNFAGSVSVSVSPNPVQNEMNLYIRSDNNSKSGMRIIDMNGRMVAEKEFSISAGMNTFSYDMSHFAKGIYEVRITQNDSVHHIKLVKE